MPNVYYQWQQCAKDDLVVRERESLGAWMPTMFGGERERCVVARFFRLESWSRFDSGRGRGWDAAKEKRHKTNPDESQRGGTDTGGNEAGWANSPLSSGEREGIEELGGVWP